MEIKKWYRMEVEYNFNDLRVLIQTQSIREKKVLFQKKIKGHYRGTIGFATNGKYIYD